MSRMTKKPQTQGYSPCASGFTISLAANWLESSQMPALSHFDSRDMTHNLIRNLNKIAARTLAKPGSHARCHLKHGHWTLDSEIQPRNRTIGWHGIVVLARCRHIHSPCRIARKIGPDFPGTGRRIQERVIPSRIGQYIRL